MHPGANVDSLGVAAWTFALSLAVSAAACSAPPAPDARVAFALGLPSGSVLTARVRRGQDPSTRVASRERFVSTQGGDCPPDMASIGGRFCIDRWEASLALVLADGREAEVQVSPFGASPAIARGRVRAVSRAGVFPQGYVSALDAERACKASGKRLCRASEWTTACKGPDKRAWGYAETRAPGTCNDRGRNPVVSKYGHGRWTWSTMNDGELNRLGQTLARTGEHDGCTNGYGVYDMVGNLHEWVADKDGTFRGGYYADVASVGHGEGCGYVTTAHEARYHDYSTGFRCCADEARR